MNRVLAALAAMGLLWTLSGAAQTAAKPDLAAGERIAKQVCAACHAPDGNSPAAANPKLAGQFAPYLHKQLRNFKAEAGKKAARESAVMAGMAAGLSDADMQAVAAYYASQTLRPAQASDKELAARGQKLWRGGDLQKGLAACAGCHGPDGAGIPGVYPRLSGQFAEYLEAQLKLFRSGARANDANGMMRGVASRLTDADIRAVAQYAAGLR